MSGEDYEAGRTRFDMTGCEGSGADVIDDYQHHRLVTFVAPIAPWVMVGAAGMCATVGIGPFLFGVHSNAGAVGAILLTATTLVALAGILRYTASHRHLDRSCFCGMVYLLVLSSGLSISFHEHGDGVSPALPFVVLASVVSTVFWLRVWHMVAGLIACFAPPMILMATTTATTTDWFRGVQLVVPTALACIGLYFLLQRANEQLFDANARLQERAMRDGLTGLLVRTVWLEYAEEAVSRNRLLQRATALIFIDLDNFKTVNDRHGHATGDLLLERAGRLLRRHAPPRALTGRFGGDEFVVLLTDVDGDAGERYVEMMRGVFDDRDLPISATFGLAVSLGDAALHELMHTADMQMLGQKIGSRR
ncbi:MAG TPA: GGDEF domain-containing protein [Thermomicrobiales bacterium]|nr:GGDEF domain-containing protein [Thermomicrobiales bacterium]